ncbi:MAG: hypothetical protein AAEJ04_07775 [Planctomycetota bacterium]
MTRLLTFSAILATLVLLQVLANRPPEVIEADKEDQSRNELGSPEQETPFQTRQQSNPQKWPIDLQTEARQALDQWQLETQLLPGLFDPTPRPEIEELLRAEWICKTSLMDLAKIIQVDDSEPRYLLLKSGSLLRYSSLQMRDQACLVTLLAGVTVRIPGHQILETRAAPTQESAVSAIAGSLPDTIQLIRKLAEGRYPSDVQWNRWFENDGPETLCRLVGTKESLILESLSQRISKNSVSNQKQVTDLQSPKALSAWMAKIRLKLRNGFPTEDREAVLLELDSWQSWLDRSGADAYRSKQTYQKTSRDLRILHLDIVKSTGF